MRAPRTGVASSYLFPKSPPPISELTLRVTVKSIGDIQPLFTKRMGSAAPNRIAAGLANLLKSLPLKHARVMSCCCNLRLHVEPLGEREH
jgi:hypothetical protein